MKAKGRILNRILGFVLVFVMGLGMMPMMSMTALAASEAPTWDQLGSITYTDGATQYLQYNNYLYKIAYTNIKDSTHLAFVRAGSGDERTLAISSNGLGFLYQANNYLARTEHMPQSPGGILECYADSETAGYMVEKDKPVVIITCMAMNEPTWNWTGVSSATATFTAAEADVFATVDASISSETVSAAADCQTKAQVQYTATVKFNGRTYTAAKTVDGAAGPHSLTYSASGNELTETCNRNGCSHSATATLTAADATYTGSAIATGASITYGEGWAGEQPQPAELADTEYTNNINVGTATVTTTVNGQKLTAAFRIDPADISGATITLTPANGEYTGSAYDPAVTVVLDGFGTLVKDRDYTVSWDKTGFTNADTYTASITGKGNFEGTGEAVFHIGDASLSDVQVKQLGTLTYNGQKQTPAVSASAVSVNNQPVTFMYYDPDPNRSDWFETVPGFTNAGTYELMYKAIAPNHNQYSNGFTVTITQATNEWVTTPSIDGWTYGGAASTPAGEAKFGTVSIWYSGTARDGTAWNSGTAPTKAGDYTATFTVDETGNYSGLEKKVDFTIAKADYDMSGAAWDYSGAFKHDGTEHKVEVGGLPAGVSVSSYSGNSASGIGKYSASVTLAYDEMNYNKPVFAYVLEWEIKQDWSQTENIGNVGGITSENVRPDDKDDLESAREDLEKALENSEIYTEDEKNAIVTELERVDAALDVIEGVENAEELIGRLPENITMGDEDAVRAAAEAYDALSDHGKSLVSEAAKKKLAEAKALLAELKKPAQSYAPETGDDSPMALYMALLVLCGGAIVALAAAGRKRRKSSK